MTTVTRALVFGLTAALVLTGCADPRPELRQCTVYEDEVLDLDDQGQCAENEEVKKRKPSSKPKAPKTPKPKPKTTKK